MKFPSKKLSTKLLIGSSVLLIAEMLFVPILLFSIYSCVGAETPNGTCSQLGFISKVTSINVYVVIVAIAVFVVGIVGLLIPRKKS